MKGRSTPRGTSGVACQRLAISARFDVTVPEVTVSASRTILRVRVTESEPGVAFVLIVQIPGAASAVKYVGQEKLARALLVLVSLVVDTLPLGLVRFTVTQAPLVGVAPRVRSSR